MIRIFLRCLLCSVLLAITSACGGGGGSDSQASNGTVPGTQRPPTADFTIPTHALRGAEISVDASLSSDDSGIATYSVDFGDATPNVTQTIPVFSHNYNASGNYSVLLTVINNQGISSSMAKIITIGMVGSTPVNLSNTPSDISQTPIISLSSNGLIIVGWYEYGDIMVSRSTDGGSTFSSGSILFPAQAGFRLGLTGIATSGNNIHTVATAFDSMYGGAEIIYAKSNNGGTTFAPSKYISPYDSTNSTTASIATDGGNTVGIVWGDTNIVEYWKPGGNYLVKSFDGGSSFTAPVKFIGQNGSSITMTTSDTYVTSLDGPSFNTQIMFMQSKNNSTALSSPMNISNTPLQAWNQIVGVDPAGNIHITWMEASDNTNKRIMYTVSTDSGVTFKAPVIIVDPSQNPTCYSMVTGSTGQVFISWVTGELFSNNFRTFLTYTTNGGTSFIQALKMPSVTNEGYCPKVIYRGANQLGITWTSPLWTPDNRRGDIYYSNIQVSP